MRCQKFNCVFVYLILVFETLINVRNGFIFILLDLDSGELSGLYSDIEDRIQSMQKSITDLNKSTDSAKNSKKYVVNTTNSFYANK